jgi:hypothetical protein
MPKAWPRLMTLAAIARSSVLVTTPATNERSIFSWSTGKRRRYDSDE